MASTINKMTPWLSRLKSKTAVKKVLVDQGSSVDILYWATYQKLQVSDTAMVPYDEPIYGFSGE